MLSIGYILEEKYEVIRVLGTGGMGTVYLCKNMRMDSLWAIKEVREDGKKNIDILSESNILKQLNHPSIPKIIDIFYENNNLYMVNEYIVGQTLKEYVEENIVMDSEFIGHTIASICEIIEYLHSFDPPIIYRDLKPSNIIVSPEGKVSLIDFGISRIYKADENSDTVCMGSNGYAAPEQCGLGQSCIQTDIYGIGMVTYFMITGKVPSTALEPLMDENYISYCSSAVSIDLKRIIQKCVQIDIKDRYTSTKELNNDVIEFLNKKKEEKTVPLINSKVALDKKLNSRKVKRSLLGMLALVAVILVILYLFNKNAKMNNKVDSQQTTVESQPVVEDKVPAIESVIPVNPTESNTSGVSKPEPKPEGKGKGKKK